MGSLVPRSWFADMPRSFFEDLTGLHRDLDFLFDSAFGRSGGTTTMWWPLVESYEKDGKMVIRCDLPGVDGKDLDLSLTGNTLTIRGERKAGHEGEGYREMRYGRFERTLTVPEGVDADKISARYEDGVLEVTLLAPAAARKVPIQIEHPEESRKKAA